MADKVKVKVIGALEVAGASPGAAVELDPDLVNIPALVLGGHVEVLPEPPRAQPSDKTQA